MAWCDKPRYKTVFLKLGPAEPQGSAKGCQGFRGTKSVMVVEVYWWSEICMYELKFVWRHSTQSFPSLIARRHSLFQFRSCMIV